MTTISTDFMKKAACKDLDTNFFFAEDAKSVRKAEEFCQTCSVKNECLNYAVSLNIIYGVWGGMNAKRRRRLIKMRKVNNNS